MSTPAQQDHIERLSPAKRALFERWMKAHRSQVADVPTIPRRASHEPSRSLSFAQQRLWFLDQLEPLSPFYNVATLVRLSGKLDAAALEAALRAVIERHDALRTTFKAVDGQPGQHVAAAGNWSLNRVALPALSAEEREGAWRALAQAESLVPFDLARGPLVRATLIRVAADDHVLLLTLHHIVCDGWSMHVLQREVAEQYTAQMEHRTANLPVLPIQYADFAAWQRKQLSDRNVDRLLDYWSRTLAVLEGPLELPLDHPRPAMQSFSGHVVRRRIDADTTRDLRRVAQSEDATLFMVLLAAFQIVLARYSGQHVVCVGTPVANRNQIQLEGLIGFFANTLAMPGDLSENPTLRSFLAQVRKTSVDGFAHQEMPFEVLVEHLNPERDLSRTPIFQAMLVWQNFPLATRQIAGLSATEVSFDHAPVSNFDVTLNIEEQPDRLDLSLIYNPDLFLAATIEQLLDSLQLLLQALTGDLERRVLEVPIVSQRTQLQLADWNDTKQTYPAESCLHELIAEQARRTPTSAAVVLDNQQLTYAELDRQSTRLASILTERGVTPDVLVGVCLERSLDLVVSLLAVLKAGGAYLPLDPQYPPARLGYLVRDSGLRLLLTSSSLRPGLPCDDVDTINIDTIDIDRSRETIDPTHREMASTSVAPHNLAYVLYTSGSTGEPKGVEIPHRGLVNHAEQLAQRMGLAPGRRILQFLSLSFDAAGEEIWPALVSGATIHLHRSPFELSGRTLLEWARVQGIDVFHLTPPIWLSLLDELSAHGPEAAAHLKTVVVGGDNVTRLDAARWQQITAGRTKFLLAYGVTEATITTTLFDASQAAAPSGLARLPIGRPIANTRVYVLDSFQQPLPIGVAGELYLAGVGVARGYRNRPDLTHERFAADLCAAVPGARMYRTGDRGRLLHDGNLEFFGRLDQQVKIRGYRIEPGEIEAALRQHPQVCDAVVLGIEDVPGDSRLVAYVESVAGATPSESNLRGFILECLPAYMLPSYWMVLRELPRLPSGKIDRSLLPNVDLHRERRERVLVPPRNEAERILTEIWAEVLGLPRVGVNDNFFEIGGDSIRSIQVIARAGAAGLRFTPKQLFQHQTIAELAPNVASTTAICAEQGPVIGPVLLAPIQHKFFGLELLDPQHFNQTLLLEVRGDLPPRIIDQAIAQLLNQHDALRHCFEVRSDGGWAQIGTPVESKSALERIDLSHLPDERLAAAIEGEASVVQAGLNLGQGPLARFAYFDLGAARPARLLIAIHHLVVDAVSWRILLADLCHLCGQLARDGATQLPPKTTSFAEWAKRLPELADSDGVRSEAAHWTSLTKCPALARDHEQGENLVANEAKVDVCLSVEDTERWLLDAQAAYRTRPHELLIAALVETLGVFQNSRQVAVDLEGHGREDLFDDVDLSRTVGWFTSLYPAVFERPIGDEPGELIKSVKEQFRAVPAGGIGYGLLRWLASDEGLRDQLAAPPREVSFNYLGQFDNLFPASAPFALATESAGACRSPRGARPHVWEIIAHVRQGRLHVAWHFAASLHRRETIEHLAAEYLSTLGRLIRHCLDPDAGGVTPTDFPLADVDQEDLDMLGALLDGPEAIAES